MADDESFSRREFLRTAGGLLGSSGGALALTGGAAGVESWRDRVPEHVTIEFDRPFLKTYKPALNLSDVDRRSIIGLYGLVARSPEYDTDVGVFWMEWTHQTGVTSFDSHRGDHEPFYVFVDDTTREVREVVFSYYHWNAQRTVNPSTYDETHPQAYVVSPWHQYQLDATAAEFLTVRDLVEDFQGWLDNGMAEDLGRNLVVEPWRMLSRGYWWEDNPLGFSAKAVALEGFEMAGIARQGGVL